jgi:hypothetical protein
MIKLIDLLAEVGEGTSQKYSWRLDTNDNTGDYIIMNYVFTTDSNVRYFVLLNIGNEPLVAIDDYEMTVSFGVGAKPSIKAKAGMAKPSFTKVVNKGELFRVMATVIDIVKDAIRVMKEEDRPIRYISFKPEKEKETETGFEQTNQRLQLYLAYIKKNMEHVQSIKTTPNAVEVILK